MVFCPVFVGDKRQKTTCGADDVVCPPGVSERLVAAVVLDDKNSNQKEGIDYCKTNSKPDRNVTPNIHRNPNSDEGQEGIEDLNCCFSGVWDLISLDDGWQLLVKVFVIHG